MLGAALTLALATTTPHLAPSPKTPAETYNLKRRTAIAATDASPGRDNDLKRNKARGGKPGSKRALEVRVAPALD